MKFATRAIHTEDISHQQLQAALMPPFYNSSTFSLNAETHQKNFCNENSKNQCHLLSLEKTLATFEEGKYATIFSSGSGALAAMAASLSPGDRVVTLGGIYSRNSRLFHQILVSSGLEVLNLARFNVKQLEEILATQPKWLMLETPSFPLMNILDVTQLTELAKKHSVITLVDNTLTSPYCQSPLKLGADVVWHSSTKYIGGDSDALGGVVVTSNQTFQTSLENYRQAMKTYLSPFDCWLLARGMKTLAVRMQHHQKNTLEVARFLKQHPLVKEVHYCGLNSHPQHQLATKQMHAFNPIFSVEFNLKSEQLLQMLSSFNCFKFRESLGGMESTVNHPTSMGYAPVPSKLKECLEIQDSLVYFSIGIEDSEDLIEDIQRTL